ncbi:MAG: hypothetical protein ACHQCF_04910 [Solirubrobacterales bacterium]
MTSAEESGAPEPSPPQPSAESPGAAEETPSPAEEAPSPAAVTSSPAEEAPAPTEVAGPINNRPIDDANDLRGYHFKRLMRREVTWILILVLMITAGVAAAIFVGAAIGGGAALLVLVVSLIVVFAIADAKAADSFFDLYAQQRSLSLGGRGMLPEATPLLSKGTKRYAERTLSGQIADGIDGTLALYTYETESTDSDGNRQTQYHRFTLGLVEVPECAQFVPELFCQQKFGLHALEKFEDVFRRSKERVTLESEALDDKFEIFSAKGQNSNWLRQLFSPTFIVWLTEESPKKFAFELVDGSLCCYIHGHKEDAAELDLVSAASSKVAGRLRDESNE